MTDLGSLFERYFEIVPAETPEALRRAQELRYQVYVVERRFEDPAAHADGIETDRFDAHSVHSLLLYDNHNGGPKSVAGNVRLILGNRLTTGQPFPIESQCGHAFYPTFRPEAVPRHALGEISRFALSKEFRKRFKEQDVTHGLTKDVDTGSHDEHGRRIIPHLTMGLFKALLTMSVAHEVSHWYAVMEPTLIRILKRFGIEFVPIGDPVEYHGKRVPCLAVVDRVVEKVHRMHPDIWRFATNDGTLWASSQHRPIDE
jgi:N-acyl amino acid synthase of PEP-CTERM/exosortase system